MPWSPGVTAPPDPARSPCPASRPSREDADLFFGREDVGARRELLRAHGFVAIVGASGSGIDGRPRRAAPNIGDAIVVRPSAQPLDALDAADIDACRRRAHRRPARGAVHAWLQPGRPAAFMRASTRIRAVRGDGAGRPLRRPGAFPISPAGWRRAKSCSARPGRGSETRRRAAPVRPRRRTGFAELVVAELGDAGRTPPRPCAARGLVAPLKGDASPSRLPRGRCSSAIAATAERDIGTRRRSQGRSTPRPPSHGRTAPMAKMLGDGPPGAS